MHGVDELSWWIAGVASFSFSFLVSHDSIYIVIACSGVFAIQLIEIGLSKWIA